MVTNEQRRAINQYLAKGQFSEPKRSVIAPVVAGLAIVGWILTMIVGNAVHNSRMQEAREHERERLRTSADYYRMQLMAAEWDLAAAEKDIEVATAARDRAAADIERLQGLLND